MSQVFQQRNFFLFQRQVCRFKYFPPMAIVQTLMDELGRGFDVTGLPNVIYTNLFIRYVMEFTVPTEYRCISSPESKKKKKFESV